MNNQNSIQDLFENLNYEKKEVNTDYEEKCWNRMETLDDLDQILKTNYNDENRCFNDAEVISRLIKAQAEWEKTPALTRASFLHRVWKALVNKSQCFSTASSLLQKEYSILIDYFDYYSNLAQPVHNEEDFMPNNVFIMYLKNCPPFVQLGTIVPAALLAGHAVMVCSTSKKVYPFVAFLEELMLETGLPPGLFVAKPSRDELWPLEAKSHFGKKFYGVHSVTLTFNNAAFILDSCDLNAAVDKTFSEVWGAHSRSMWRLSTVVVQESVHQSFLKKLEFRIKQFKMENKNLSKFMDRQILNEMCVLTENVTKAGASVKKYCDNENEWGPVVIENYFEEIDDSLPVLKVLICRTAKEGISLLNNCKKNNGTSIWTNISSEALEIASKLNCSNSWINCHGIIKASVPYDLCTELLYRFVVGGIDGLYQYKNYKRHIKVLSSNYKASEPEKLKVFQCVATAKMAFSKWQPTKNKREYLKNLADALQENHELQAFSETVNSCAHYVDINFSENYSDDEFIAFHKKIPVGVIVLYVSTTDIDAKSFVSLVTNAIGFGNALVVLLKKEDSFVASLEKQFNKILPKNLFNVIVSSVSIDDILFDRTCEVIWVYPEIEYILYNGMDKIWFVPKFVPSSKFLFQNKCLKNKVVWLPKIDHF